VPRTRTARKADRASKRKQARNRSIKSAVKTYITRIEKLIYDNELEKAQAVAVTTMSTLDKAAQKNILHPNTASRQKSRLTIKLNKALAAQKTEEKPAKPAEPAKAAKATKTTRTAKAAKTAPAEAVEKAGENVEQET
jgi:small subunit ribosomal protein S20